MLVWVRVFPVNHNPSMRADGNQLFGVRAATFVVAALAAASAAYWGLRLVGTGDTGGLVQTTGMPAAQAVDSQAVARALGGAVAADAAALAPPVVAAAASSRFALLGVVADSASSGAALISIDGKPARPFRVGATVDGSLVLQSVTARKAKLASGAAAPVEVTLELPALTP